jgi:hypothetical protein
MLRFLLSLLHFPFLAPSVRELALENLALRQQLAVMKRKRPRPPLRKADRVFGVWLSRSWNHWRQALVIVRPETVVSWHRKGFRLFWTCISRPKPRGRPEVGPEIRGLIRRMAQANPLWGAPRIHGELLNWQNAFVERLLGSIRRECLDHVIVLGERRLRNILKGYFDYSEHTRTHLSLSKDAPCPRASEPPEVGPVVQVPQVGGLHHRYQRRAA